MSALDPNTARLIVEDRGDAAAVLKKGRSGDHRQYAFRYKLLNPNGRHIAIAASDTRDPSTPGTKGGATVYINKLSRALQPFPTVFTERHLPGVTVTKEYLKGTSGSTGDKGLSSAAASLDTLDPRDHDVLRLSVIDRAAFQRLLKWYAGEIQFATSQPPAPNTFSADDLGARFTQLNATTHFLDSNTTGPANTAESEAVGTAAELSPDDVESDEEFRIMSDPERRQIVERHAVDIARAHYQSQEFTVHERGKPFDLECHAPVGGVHGRQLVHVEVKGTVGSGRTVHLTRNEVRDASGRGEWRSDLFIVSGITLERSAPNSVWRAAGGTVRWIPDWRPEEADLEVTDYAYRVPEEGD